MYSKLQLNYPDFRNYQEFETENDLLYVLIIKNEKEANFIVGNYNNNKFMIYYEGELNKAFKIYLKDLERNGVDISSKRY